MERGITLKCGNYVQLSEESMGEGVVWEVRQITTSSSVYHWICSTRVGWVSGRDGVVSLEWYRYVCVYIIYTFWLQPTQKRWCGLSRIWVQPSCRGRTVTLLLLKTFNTSYYWTRNFNQSLNWRALHKDSWSLCCFPLGSLHLGTFLGIGGLTRPKRWTNINEVIKQRWSMYAWNV